MLRFFLKIALLACAVLAAVLCLRAFTLTRSAPTKSVVAMPPIDAARAAERLGRLLSVPTVSRTVETAIDAEPFAELQRRMQEAFAKTFATLERRDFGPSFVLRWAGERDERALLFLAHQDVVPVEQEKEWVHPPFSGDVADGFVWGRGALDDKASLAAMLEAVELLLEAGVRPQNTVYFAFGHDEEIGGLQGAKRIAEQFAASRVRFRAVIDEGPMVEQGLLPGLQRPVAKIGLAEKGYVDIELRTESDGGHASMPPEQTSVGVLAKAVAAVEAAPMPARLSAPLRAQLTFLAPEMPFGARLAFANLWLFSPMIVSRMERAAASNALVRTTLAPTVFEGSVRANVLAKQARAVLNVRLLPGDTIAGAVVHVREVIDDARVRVEPLTQIASEASAVARTTTPMFARLEAALRSVHPDAVVAPALVVIATDSRHYAALSDDIYRVLPVLASAEDLKRLHGTNERIGIDAYAKLVRFYAELLAGRMNAGDE